MINWSWWAHLKYGKANRGSQSINNSRLPRTEICLLPTVRGSICPNKLGTDRTVSRHRKGICFHWIRPCLNQQQTQCLEQFRLAAQGTQIRVVQEEKKLTSHRLFWIGTFAKTKNWWESATIYVLKISNCFPMYTYN